MQVQRKFSYFKIHLTVQLKGFYLYLEVIHLQCTNMIKGEYKEKNLRQFYECFSHDEYAQLKYMPMDCYQYVTVLIYVKDIVKGEIHKIPSKSSTNT